MEHSADKYEAVRKYPILSGYLEHFREVSKNNEIPGLLSFFFIQGQAALPYVRIPMGGSNLDPRVSVFWIQDTRTGKSVAYETIGKVMEDAGLEVIDCSVATDAAMVGTFDTTGDRPIPKYGVLKGRKGLNFDEGSILLKPGQHSENLVLHLQTALNAAGTGRNKLSKHMKDGSFDYLSYVSLWITTYPPDGIKDYVLDKGIFQRVLLYWRNWTVDMKMEVAYELADSLYKKQDFTLDYTDITNYFKEVDVRLKARLSKVADITISEIDEAKDNEDDKAEMERHAAKGKYSLFTLDPSYKPALNQAIEEYYELVQYMDKKKQAICASFLMGLQNYTTVFAHHMAILEGVWVVTGEHVDMAKEILYDLYKNLLHWLEEEVKVGMSKTDLSKEIKAWQDTIVRCEKIEIENKGGNWVAKKGLYETFGKINNLNSASAINNRFNQVLSQFDTCKVATKKYVRIKKEA